MEAGPSRKTLVTNTHLFNCTNHDSDSKILSVRILLKNLYCWGIVINRMLSKLCTIPMTALSVRFSYFDLLNHDIQHEKVLASLQIVAIASKINFKPSSCGWIITKNVQNKASYGCNTSPIIRNRRIFNKYPLAFHYKASTQSNDESQCQSIKKRFLQSFNKHSLTRKRSLPI